MSERALLRTDGLWRDFLTPAGEASEWPSGFIGATLELAGGDEAALHRCADARVGLQNDDGGWGYNEAVPTDAGEDVVRTVRASVWGEPDAALGGLPRGAAFAAFAMGFIAGEEPARRYSSGPWTRLSLVRGHVLVRGPVRVGLTQVRSTGAGTL